jgi:hypothetical protein
MPYMNIYELEKQHQRRIEEDRHQQLVNMGQQSLSLEQQRLHEQRIFNQKLLEQSITEKMAFKKGNEINFEDGDIWINHEGVVWNSLKLQSPYLDDKLTEAYNNGLTTNFNKIFPHFDWDNISKQIEFIGEDLHKFIKDKSLDYLEKKKADSTKHSNDYNDPEYERTAKIMYNSPYNQKKYAIDILKFKIKITISYDQNYQISIKDSQTVQANFPYRSINSPLFINDLNEIFSKSLNINNLKTNINQVGAEALKSIRFSDLKIEKNFRRSNIAENINGALIAGIAWCFIGAFIGIFTGLIGGWSVFFGTVGFFGLIGFFYKLND